MNELLGKITNLSYEVFGVFLPGLVLTLFLILYWAAMGSAAPFLSLYVVPAFPPSNTWHLNEALTSIGEAIVFTCVLAVWYLFGHLLMWVSRGGRADAGARKSGLRRVALSLAFRIPTPTESYDQKLESLFDSVAKDFFPITTPVEWRQFYPVVKTFLSQRLTYSLVATYQNKYTFHRSVTGAATVLFWLTLLGLVGGLVACRLHQPQPSWPALWGLLAGSLAVVWGFSSSFMMHWSMFGNTIVTEAYSLLHGPQDDRPQK
jgi:hypothetical protein